MRFLRTLSCLILLGASSLAAAQDQPVFETTEPTAGDAPPAEAVPEPPPTQEQTQPAPQAPPPQAQQVPVANGPMQPTAIDQAPRSERARNSLYGELLGGGLLYSLNYEHLVLDDLAIRAGIGVWTISPIDSDLRGVYVTVPLTASYLGLGSDRHIFEVGGGMTLAFATITETFVGSRAAVATGFGQAFAGYRLHPVRGSGFLFRAGAMVIIGRGLIIRDSRRATNPAGLGAIPWGYLSMGASF